MNGSEIMGYMGDMKVGMWKDIREVLEVDLGVFGCWWGKCGFVIRREGWMG